MWLEMEFLLRASYIESETAVSQKGSDIWERRMIDSRKLYSVN